MPRTNGQKTQMIKTIVECPATLRFGVVQDRLRYLSEKDALRRNRPFSEWTQAKGFAPKHRHRTDDAVVSRIHGGVGVGCGLSDRRQLSAKLRSFVDFLAARFCQGSGVGQLVQRPAGPDAPARRTIKPECRAYL
jgi:hypothetical protein